MRKKAMPKKEKMSRTEFTQCLFVVNAKKDELVGGPQRKLRKLKMDTLKKLMSEGLVSSIRRTYKDGTCLYSLRVGNFAFHLPPKKDIIKAVKRYDQIRKSEQPSARQLFLEASKEDIAEVS